MIRLRPASAPPEAFVPTHPRSVVAPLVWFRLGPADRSLVGPRDVIAAGDPLLERARESHLLRMTPPAGSSPGPGALVGHRGGEHDEPPAGRGRGDERGRVLYSAPDGRLRVAAARGPYVVASPVAGEVEVLAPGALGVRADGYGIPGAFATGDAVRGRLVLAVPAPDADLRARAIDVEAAGAIVVAGARVDIEAVTRARAIGVRGIVTGGILGKDLRTMAAAEARQRASLHAAAPFGVLVVDGYGRRPLPGAIWQLFAGAAGRDAGIVLDPPMLVVDGVPPQPGDPRHVRVAAGEHVGREGLILTLCGPVRQPSGLYAPSALVAFASAVEGAPATEVVLPLADLQRFR